MSSYVLEFQAIDGTKRSLVGGKGAGLGEISRIPGVRVPEGFCVTTEAFARVVGATLSTDDRLRRLSLLRADERDPISALSAEIRRLIEGIPLPDDLTAAISRQLASLGEQSAYAVRSSATSEDSPTASFAGQHETYLNVTGPDAVLAHIRRCWASLFTDRAVTYRLQNGFDHRDVQLAVVVQKMVSPQAAGILFTADPVSANRKVSSIEAGFGLGEALVSGRVNADVYRVRDGQVIDRAIATKPLAIVASPDGGTEEVAIAPEQRNSQVLTDEQVVRLAQLGRAIEAHVGHPQDIEWCLVDQAFHVVQSRPITTLYPLPDAHDQDNHVYVSVGHQQMMTDAIKPLGLSFWQLTAPRPMYQAGGRLFVDIAPDLASPAKRHMLVNVLGKSDPLVRDAMETILERGDFIPPLPSEAPEPARAAGQAPPNYQAMLENDPAIVQALIANSRAAIDALKHDIRSKSGEALFDFILEDFRKRQAESADPRNFGAIMTGMNAASWLNDKLFEWLGEKNVADTLSQSAPNNVTSEMGLELLDVADAIRPYPDVIDYLRQAKDDDFLDGLLALDGGRAAHDAIRAYLDKYGMRCVGEIDITKTRWSEKPTTLIPIILLNIRNFEPNAGHLKFEQGRQEASSKEQDVLARLKHLPDGDQKAAETQRMISLLRNFIGYREYPKYGIVNRYFVYKQALMREADRLVDAGVVRDREDVYFLTFEEFREVVRTQRLDQALISRRKDAFELYEKLTPPRVMTSEGEILNGRFKRENLPPDALVGLPVSAGVIEGRARVIRHIEDADLEAGDILVTAFTDPSWTPLFVSIKGLVTEVGGLMTHGAVIAREYGLPAVVGVAHATRLIRDGQRIRVHGTDGYVELL